MAVSFMQDDNTLTKGASAIGAFPPIGPVVRLDLGIFKTDIIMLGELGCVSIPSPEAIKDVDGTSNCGSSVTSIPFESARPLPRRL